MFQSQKRTVILGIIVCANFLFFINCSKTNSTENGNTTTADPGATSTIYTAWNPPLGSAISGGLATSEGWSTPNFVASPINPTVNGGWLDSVTVSRDGLELYFAYSKRDAQEYLFNSANEVINGAPLTVENTTKYLQIFNAKLSSTGFSISYSTANYSNAVDLGGPAINSSKDYMLFTAYPVSGNKIKLAQLISGTWQVLGDLASPVNGTGGCHDDNPFLIGNAASGTIYWQSRRSDLAGTTCRSDQLQRYYFATVTNGSLSGAQLVPGLSSATSNDYEASFSEDKTKAYWTRTDTAPATFAIMTADWNGSAYGTIRPIISINNFAPPFDDKIVDIGEPNVVELPEGYLMYFRCVVALSTSGGQPAQRQLRFCVSKKTK